MLDQVEAELTSVNPTSRIDGAGAPAVRPSRIVGSMSTLRPSFVPSRGFARPGPVAAFALAASASACTDAETERSAESVRGPWFHCELERARDPNCLVLDDDGFELAAAGRVRAIEETGQGSLPECEGSTCFPSTLDASRVTRGDELGSWVYGNGLLTLVVNGCAERLEPRIDEALGVFDVCTPPLDDSATARDVVRVRRFTGAVEYTNP